MEITSLTVEQFCDNPTDCLRIINDSLNEIPMLQHRQTKNHNGNLFRYRGMIQDMPNPVYYFSKYGVCDKNTGQKKIMCGKYKDNLLYGENDVLNLESPDCKNEERRPYFLVPVPGVSDWAQFKFKRSEDSESAVNMESEPIPFAQSDSKRTAEEMEVDDTENESSKRHCKEITGEGSSVPDTSNRTLHDTAAMGCLAMMYDVPEDSLKLNEVLDVVGFAYFDPISTDEDEFDDCYKPPSPFTPRLHAVTFTKITNFNPLINPNDNSVKEEILPEIESLRSDLHLALSQLFFGDTLIADYLICHLIAQIYHRDDTGIVLGKFSINISQLPESFSCEDVFKILSKLIPKIKYLPFTIDSLNKDELLPRKNYKSGHLEHGILQLSNNTHLVIDETKLTEGKLKDIGVRNVNCLNNLINSQKLDYDFTYYSVSFDTDIPVLILSQTKSILQSDIHISMVPDKSCSSKTEESIEAVNKFLNDSLLQKIRVYLSLAANLNFNLPDEFQSIVQDDFVALRQNDQSFSANELHELLVLSRFLSLSHFKSSLERETWDRAKAMIIERRSRS